MSARELSRGHLEAVLVARAILAPDPAPILAAVDRTVVSPAAVTLLEQILDGDCGLVRTATKGQRELADRVEAVTLGELLIWPLTTLLGLVNGLPPRPVLQPTWERDLARADAIEVAS